MTTFLQPRDGWLPIIVNQPQVGCWTCRKPLPPGSEAWKRFVPLAIECDACRQDHWNRQQPEKF